MKRIGLIFLSVLLCSMCAACGGKESFSDHIETGEYLAAIEDYQTHIYGKIDKEMEAQNFVTTYLSDSMKKYLAGEISESEMEQILACVQKVDDELSIVTEELEQTTDTFESLVIKKKCCEKIEGYFETITGIESVENGLQKAELEKLKPIFPLNGDGEEIDYLQGEKLYSFQGPEESDFGKEFSHYEITRVNYLSEENLGIQNKVKDIFISHGSYGSPEWSRVLPEADDLIELDCEIYFENSNEPSPHSFLFLQTGDNIELLILCTYEHGDDVDSQGGLINYYKNNY